MYFVRFFCIHLYFFRICLGSFFIMWLTYFYFNIVYHVLWYTHLKNQGFRIVYSTRNQMVSGSNLVWRVKRSRILMVNFFASLPQKTKTTIITTKTTNVYRGLVYVKSVVVQCPPQSDVLKPIQVAWGASSDVVLSSDHGSRLDSCDHDFQPCNLIMV